MDFKKQRDALLKAIKGVVEAAQAESRDLTNDEQSDIEAKFAEVDDLNKKIAAEAKSKELMGRISSLGVAGQSTDGDNAPAKSIGDHFVKELGGRSIKSLTRFQTTEFKAATDTQVVGGNTGAFGPLVTDIDRSFVLPYRQRLVVADLLGVGSVSGNAITYPVFGALEGGPDFVGEGGHKPQFHNADPTWVTDALGEVAGFFKITDDMAEDLAYVVSEIEGAARYDLLAKEEQALLNGNGTSPNLRGLLNRSGIQVATKGSDSAADAVFKALTKVSRVSGFEADGIVINPEDYEALRLSKDGNGQYFGGGFFYSPYGNAGELSVTPPLWGRRTVVTPAIAAGTVLVGAFQASSKVFRKGGLRVESTNSNVDDFENDKITIRLRERLGLQVRYPKALVKLNLAA